MFVRGIVSSTDSVKLHSLPPKMGVPLNHTQVKHTCR